MTDTERIDKLVEIVSTRLEQRVDTMAGVDFEWWMISFRAPVEAKTLREAIDAMIPEADDERP